MGAIEPPADALVLGGGPAGCAAAIGLARSGARVTVLERERGPIAKVCGEFLSVEACSAARALGVDPAELGAAPIDRLRVTWCGITTESRLPFLASSVSRAAFDEALLRAAANAGARIERGARVLNVDDGVATVRTSDALVNKTARAIVLASGKADIGGARRSGSRPSDALGFKMHLEPGDAELERLGTAVELVLFAGGYAGMQRIEGRRVALAAVVDRRTFARWGSWRGLIAEIERCNARFAQLLVAMHEVWPKPLAVSGIPYGFVHRDHAEATNACFRVGDQLAVIPSFTGDGIAIALTSGTLAAVAIERGDAPATFHAAMRRRLAKPMMVSAAVAKTIASPAGRATLVGLGKLAPVVLSLLATHTRISDARP